MSELSQDVTRILQSWTDGDPKALDALMPLVVDELRGLARHYLGRETRNHTLQPTALVNEVYLRLEGRRTVRWENRAQFFGFSAQLMRRILVDHARGRRTSKRGGGARPMSLEDAGFEIPVSQDIDLVALDDALKDLAALDERQCSIVELRFFAGLTNDEIADVLDISATTVKREWRTARFWLYQAMRPSRPR